MSVKTTELVIYIADQLKDNPNYGATLLNKALYYTDLMQYLTNGTTISDLQYIHQDQGPTPEPARFLQLLQLLRDNGDIEITEVLFFNYKQKKVLAVSDQTHELLAWKLSEKMEVLPNYTFLLTSKEPEVSDYEWAERAWDRYNQKKSNL